MRETILGFFGSLLLRILNLTLRWEKSGLEIEGRHWSYAEPTIVAIWHGDQLLAPFSYKGFKPPASNKKLKPRMTSVLVSQHSDGRIMAEALRFLSVENTPGSSSNGGLRALVQMKHKLLKEKKHITITPDGPKGPPRKAKLGIISLSSQTGAKILPIGISYDKFWKLGSWDSMLIPKPFSKAKMIGGKLISIPKNLCKEAMEEQSIKLGIALNQLR